MSQSGEPSCFHSFNLNGALIKTLTQALAILLLDFKETKSDDWATVSGWGLCSQIHIQTDSFGIELNIKNELN